MTRHSRYPVSYANLATTSTIWVYVKLEIQTKDATFSRTNRSVSNAWIAMIITQWRITSVSRFKYLIASSRWLTMLAKVAIWNISLTPPTANVTSLAKYFSLIVPNTTTQRPVTSVRLHIVSQITRYAYRWQSTILTAFSMTRTPTA